MTHVLLACVVITTMTQFAFAESTAPFIVGYPIVQGNGCPDGTYSVVLSPDGTEMSILFSAFTAETDADHSYDFANCNIAIPIDVPTGVTVGLVGIDYRGLAYIPNGGFGTLSREYFFAGKQGSQIVSVIEEYDEFYEFYYDDDLPFVLWSNCGDDLIARSNATIMVTRQHESRNQALMTVFSEDWDVSILFHLVWRYC
jgi:hypothetical protein